MKLYEITDAYNAIMDEVEQNEGLISDEAIIALDKIEEDMNHKVENIVHLIRNFEADAEQCKNEVTRLTALQKSKCNNAKRLRDYLLFQFQKTGTKKIDAVTCVVSIRKNAPSVMIDEPDRVPDYLLTAKLTVSADRLPNELRENADITPDKTAIKKLIQTDGPVSWAHLQPSESVSIR